MVAGSEKGGYDDFQSAQAAMTSLKDESYKPNAEAQAVYNDLYAEYKKLHDAFGGVGASDLGGVMKRLLEIKEAARQG